MPEPSRLERGFRLRPTECRPDGDPWCQCNVRLRRSMMEMLDERRNALGLSRDEWMRHVVEWALLQPPGTPVHSYAARNGHRGRRLP